METIVKGLPKEISTFLSMATPHGLAMLINIASSYLANALPLPSVPITRSTLIEVREVAERLNVSRRWIYAHADELPFVRRVGRNVRVDLAGLEQWMAGPRTLPTKPEA
jgi:excisionase family DNA binding protein